MIYTEDSKSNWAEEILELHCMLSQMIFKLDSMSEQKIDSLRFLYLKTLKVAIDGLKLNMESLIAANCTNNYDKNNKIIYLNVKK
jgi:hypothetical protein